MVANIRFALPEDIDFIFECIHQLGKFEGVEDTINVTKNTLFKWLFEQNICQVLVGEVGNERIGIALYYYNYSVYVGTRGMYLENLYLVPEYRRQGIGTQIMNYLCEIAKQNACGVLTVSCLTYNAPANAFYASYKMQFKEAVNTYEIVF